MDFNARPELAQVWALAVDAAERRLVMQLKFRKRVMRSLTDLVGRVREWDSQLFGSQRDLFPPLPPARPTAAARSPTSVLVAWQVGTLTLTLTLTLTSAAP